MYLKAKSLLFTVTLLKGRYFLKNKLRRKHWEKSYGNVLPFFLTHDKLITCFRNHFNCYYHFIYISLLSLKISTLYSNSLMIFISLLGYTSLKTQSCSLYSITIFSIIRWRNEWVNKRMHEYCYFAHFQTSSK